MSNFDPEYRIRLGKIEERLKDPNSDLNINSLLVRRGNKGGGGRGGANPPPRSQISIIIAVMSRI